VAVVFLLSVGCWYLVRVPYVNTVVRGSGPILKQVIPTHGQQPLHLVGDTLAVNTGIPSPRGAGRMMSLRQPGIYRTAWNTALLLMLICLTPRARLRTGWYFVLLAVGVVWCAQVLTLACESLHQVASLHHELGRTLLSARGHRLVQRTSAYLQYASPFIPVLAILPVWVKRRKSPRPALHAVGRNDACPCGSGRKFKHCCGGRR
jgi:hypothetical protein